MVWLFANHYQTKGNNMKENETVGREELESINSELFHSFDPEEASWVIGGRPKVSASGSGFVATTDRNDAVPHWDADVDYEF
jgi:hypothetical protein